MAIRLRKLGIATALLLAGIEVLVLLLTVFVVVVDNAGMSLSVFSRKVYTDVSIFVVDVSVANDRFPANLVYGDRSFEQSMWLIPGVRYYRLSNHYYYDPTAVALPQEARKNSPKLTVRVDVVRVTPVTCIVVVFVLMTPMLVSHLLKQARERSSRHNKCIHCGYDLRASGDRCPECGSLR